MCVVSGNNERPLWRSRFVTKNRIYAVVGRRPAAQLGPAHTLYPSGASPVVAAASKTNRGDGGGCDGGDAEDTAVARQNALARKLRARLCSDDSDEVLELRVDGHAIRAHRCLINARVPFLEAMLRFEHTTGPSKRSLDLKLP